MFNAEDTPDALGRKILDELPRDFVGNAFLSNVEYLRSEQILVFTFEYTEKFSGTSVILERVAKANWRSSVRWLRQPRGFSSASLCL